MYETSTTHILCTMYIYTILQAVQYYLYCTTAVALAVINGQLYQYSKLHAKPTVYRAEGQC